MALTHLSELYLTPSPLENRLNQPSIEDFLDKKSYRWKNLRRVMRIIADKYHLTGLKDPNCDDAVKMVLNNVPDMKHMISDIESNRKLALLMVKNRAERVRKSILRKGGLRIYKRKINQKERQRWDAMTNDRSKRAMASKENTVYEANLSTSSLVGEASQILYGDDGDDEWQQNSPVHHTPWTTPESVSTRSPSSPGMSTPRRRSASRSSSPRGLVECMTTPTQANRKDAGNHVTKSPCVRKTPTHAPSTSISSPVLHTESEGDGSPTPKKGWKGWAVARNEEDLIPQKKFEPKSGQRTRKRRRVLDI